jgi:allophanate hydrolase subunit 2
MKKKAIAVEGSGLFFEVKPPFFGKQDIGVSPGGAMDLFAVASGNAVLGQDTGSPALEIVIPPKINFMTECCFILTGAKRSEAKLTRRGKALSIDHATVGHARKGASLSLGKTEYGLRTYLCYRPIGTGEKEVAERLTGRRRGDFATICRWQDEDGKIRVIEGPESSWLQNPSAFVDGSWTVSTEMSRMGMRLQPIGIPAIQPISDLMNMVSGPVNDGTIQLTPGGPIILLRHRQTVGGYPRIFNVIGTDVDLLAQYAPRQILRFRLVGFEEALAAARQKREDLEAIRCLFGFF